MLVLSRYVEESIYFDVAGVRIEVKLVEIRKGAARLGITAPPEVRIVRDNAKNVEPKHEQGSI